MNDKKLFCFCFACFVFLIKFCLEKKKEEDFSCQNFRNKLYQRLIEV
jgi:hypothetical protein